MLATMINIITAPGETMDSILKEFNWKQAMMPVALLMVLATFSGFILSDQIADLQWEQIEKSINNNANIPDEQKEEILSSQYDRVYSGSGAAAIFAYVSMAISWPIRILFWALFAMLVANIVLGGGGAFNNILVKGILDLTVKKRLKSLGKGMNEKNLESMAFAWLASIRIANKNLLNLQ